MLHEELTQKIIGCAMKVHSTLGPGYLESVYQNALAHELRKNGIECELKTPLEVFYDDVLVGRFETDMLVEKVVMIENKATQSISPAHEVQLVNYLTATRTDVGLVLNFGAASLQLKRNHREYKKN